MNFGLNIAGLEDIFNEILIISQDTMIRFLGEMCNGQVLFLLLLLKRLAVQGRERAINTISVRRPQPHKYLKMC